MSYLVDTNVYCEALQAKPDLKVVEWLRENESAIYLSSITIGEIRRGIERLPEGKKKSKLQAWLQIVCETMRGRILSFNVSTAHVWGQLKAKGEANGFVFPSIDSQIAATAIRYDLTIVTRNTKDFTNTGAHVLNPFSS